VCQGTVSVEAAASGALSGVVAVAMAGSRTAAVADERSDVNLYLCYYTQLNVLSFKVFAL
jgi:hypothetical protein